jgi:DNA-directed RNA polymerase subunit M/transcription elongation factor TFIIS
MTSIQILVLTQKAEVKLSKIPLNNDKLLTLNHIQKYFKKKNEVEVLGTYFYKSNTLYLFGFTQGKAGNENKHELPPPHDATLAFGDIVLIASKSEDSFAEPVSFTVEDYEHFYAKAFGGFDDLDDEESDDDIIEEEIDTVDIDNVDIVDTEEVDEAICDKASYISEEEIIILKKEKKKKVSNLIINNIIIHPDKQLQANSEKNNLRNNTIKSLNNLFKDIFNTDEVNILEDEIYKASLKEADSKYVIKDWCIKMYETIYLTLVRRIVSNLHSKSYVKNNELIERYKKNEITFQDICSMNHYTLFESKWKERIEHQKLIEKRHIEGNKSMATEQFLCTRCHKRECTYYEMQTRSADEPMTIFINCLNCGKNWRQ